MSFQRFTNAFREALWEAHGRKCLYCRRDLLFAQMEIDHLLPETLDDDPKALSEIRQRVGLNLDFNITGFENLAPSCSGCNADKLDRKLPAGSIAIFAAKIAERIPALETALEKRRSARDLDSTLRFIARAIEDGTYTPEQLYTGLRFLERFGGGVVGHSPEAPPPSPELPKYGAFSDDHSVVFTTHALESMTARGVTTTDVMRALHGSIQKFVISAQKSSGDKGAYTIRGERNLRIVYRFDGQQIRIVSVFWRA